MSRPSVADVTCIYPDDQFEEGGEPPEGFDEWRSSPTCSHGYCVEADDALRIWQGQRQARLSQAEREEVRADHELMADEFHGRFEDI